MHADFMAGRNDHLGELREGFDGVPGNEPGGGEVVLVEQADEPWAPHFAAEHAAGDVTRGVLTAVGAEHSGYGVDVHSECDLNIFFHEYAFSVE